MQQWKVSKARLHTGYRLSGHSERNSAGPRVENMSRDSPVLPNMGRNRAFSTPSRQLPPSSSPEDHAQAEHSPDSVSVDNEEAPSSKLTSSAGINVNDYGNELDAKADKYLNTPRDESCFQEFSKELLPRIERKLKARIDIRKRLNQRLRARLAEIEECNKYCAKMEKMMEELEAAREETERLESAIKPAAEKFKDSSKQWFRLGGEWGAEAEWMRDRSNARGVDDELERVEGEGSEMP